MERHIYSYEDVRRENIELNVNDIVTVSEHRRFRVTSKVYEGTIGVPITIKYTLAPYEDMMRNISYLWEDNGVFDYTPTESFTIEQFITPRRTNPVIEFMPQKIKDTPKETIQEFLKLLE